MTSIIRKLLLSATCFGTALMASAQTISWTGAAGNSNWNNASNWSAGEPGSGNVAQFNLSTASINLPNVNKNTTIDSLVFNGSANAYTFDGGRTLTLNPSGGIGLNNAVGYVQTFGNKFTVGSDQIWQTAGGGGGLTFDGNVNLGGNNLTLRATSGAPQINFNGNVSGSNSSLIVGGNGRTITVNLDGNGSYTGPTTINSGGTLRTVGSGTLASSADVTINSGGTYDLNGLDDSISTIAGAGNVALGSATLRLNGNSSTTISGVISGTGGSIDKRGSSTLTLSGANTFTGGLVLNSGSLEVGSNSALGTGTLDLSGGTLTATANRTLANDLAMSGNSAIAAGPGVNLVFSSNNIAPGSGTLTLDNLTDAGTHFAVGFSGSGAGFDFDRSISFDDAATELKFLNPTGVQTFSGAISGAGSLIRNAAGGTTLLDANNTFTGSLSLLAGTVQIANENRLGATPGSPTPGKIIFDGGALNTTASITIDSNRGITLNSGGGTFVPDATTTLTYDGIMAGTGGFNLTGGGTLALTGASTFAGKVAVKDGTLNVTSLNRVSGGSASSNLGAPTTVANGTIALGSSATTGTLAVNSGTFQITDRVIDLAGTTGGGVIDSSGAGGLAFIGNVTATGAGAKTLTLQGDNAASALGGAIANGAGTTALTKDGTGTWTLNGAAANTATGLTRVNAGTLALAKTGGATAVNGNLSIGDGAGTDTLQLGGDNQIADTSLVTVASSGVFDVNGHTETIGGLTAASGAAQVLLASGALTVNSAATSTYAGTISGSGSLTKTGTGNLALTASNGSFTGPTNVNGGTVNLQNANALGSGAVSVGSGGNLELQGGITLANTLNLAGPGTAANDGALENLSGTNTASGAITLGGSATIAANGNATSNTTLNLTGGIDVSTPSHSALTFKTGDSSATATTIVETGAVKNGSVTVASGATPTGNASGNTYNLITATGSGGTLTKSGAGTLTLKGAHTDTLDGITLTLGNITVGDGSATATTLRTGAIGSANANNVLTITSNSTVQGFFSSGTVTAANTFTGQLAGAGTFQKDGAGILAFNAGFSATNLTLLVTGGEIDLRGGANVAFGTIHLAGDTILDFDSSSATSLTSANLIIDAGVTITVKNWMSETDFWYATGGQGTFYTLNGSTHTDAIHNTSGSGPLSQITFSGTGFSAANSTWIQAPWGGYRGGELRPVPEPATYGLLLMFASLSLVMWRQRRRAG